MARLATAVAQLDDRDRILLLAMAKQMARKHTQKFVRPEVFPLVGLFVAWKQSSFELLLNVDGVCDWHGLASFRTRESQVTIEEPPAASRVSSRVPSTYKTWDVHERSRCRGRAVTFGYLTIGKCRKPAAFHWA